jgi:hypothetical protein
VNTLPDGPPPVPPEPARPTDLDPELVWLVDPDLPVLPCAPFAPPACPYCCGALEVAGGMTYCPCCDTLPEPGAPDVIVDQVDG